MSRSAFAASAALAVDALRSGRWITAERVRLYGRTAAVMSGLALLALVATSHGLVDRLGRPVGTDFSAFYAAGALARAGEAAAAYDWARLHAFQQQMFGEGALFYSWSYPPFALLPIRHISTLGSCQSESFLSVAAPPGTQWKNKMAGASL